VIVDLSAIDPAALAAAVLAESARHKLRSPGRRAAGHLWVCLMTTTSPAAARRAIATFGDERTQADAASLLARLAAELVALTEQDQPT
jgi:hypothetical protein